MKSVFKIFILITLMILFLELGIRIIMPQPISPVIAELDPVLGYKLKTNTKGIHRTSEFDTVLEINSKGLRENEVLYNKENSKKRILFLGDSQTYGWGVNKENRFTELIGKELDFEIINAGIPGYKLSNTLVYFEEEGFKYKPDILIIMYNLNTGLVNINTNYYKVVNNTLIKTNLLATSKKNYFKKIVNAIPGYSFLAQKSQLVALVRNSMVNILNKDFIESRLANCSVHKKNWEDENKLREFLILQKFRELTLKENIKLVVVILPFRECKFEILNELEIKLSNTTILDLNYYFDNNLNEYYYEYDGHWNQKGHKLVSKALINYLRKLTSPR